MALHDTPIRMTVDEYFAFEQAAEGRHEFVDGQIFAMSGASSNHARITPVLALICGSALRGRPCRYFDQDTKVVINESGNYYYADGGIGCPPNWVNETNGVIDNPTVIFEVLSPGSEGRDRGGKFQDYQRLPSLQDYVLIDSEKPRVEVFSRQEDGSWVLRAFLPGSTAFLPSVEIRLSLDELYEDAVFPSAPVAENTNV